MLERWKFRESAFVPCANESEALSGAELEVEEDSKIRGSEDGRRKSAGAAGGGCDG